MKTIKLQSENGEINQDYLVDLIGNNEQFAIYDAKYNVNGVEYLGVSDNAIKFGLPDKNVNIDKEVTGGGATHTTLSMTQAVALAVAKNLTMTVVEEGESNVVKNTLTDFAWVTETIDAGVCGVKQLEVVTFPTTAGAAQGDYIVLTNALTGKKVALWLDKDANGTAPTGVKFTGADYQVKVSIVTDGTAAANGTLAYTALAASDWADEISLTDNLDGTVDVQQDYSGVTAEADPENEDSTGAGSITATTSAPGTAGTAYEFQLVTEGGSPAISFTTESTLPVGLTLLSTGLIAGTPREDGTFALTITATDFFGNEVELTAKNLVVTETE